MGERQTTECLIRDATARLLAVGSASPRLDAEMLMAAALGTDRVGLIRDRDERVDDRPREVFLRYVERRLTQEPVAYILGVREFYGRTFEVGPNVLIPRPETELLVEAALAEIGVWPAGTPSDGRAPLILDLGTGSGAIGVTLAAETEASTSPPRVVCSDISQAALGVARANARRHGVAGRIDFVCADGLAGLLATFDLIVSNPPYIGRDEEAGLMPDVRCYEPALALYSGASGMDFVDRLLADSPGFLRPDGALIFEIGYRQGDDTLARARANPLWASAECRKDLAGHDRVIALRRC